MRTIDDLRTAFDDLAGTAPDVDSLSVPTATVRRPLRRTLAPAAAALVTAAVAVGVLVATVTTPGPDQPAPMGESVVALRYPAADGPVDTTFRFTAHLAGGEPADRRYSVDRAGQQLEFFSTDRNCELSPPADRLKPNCARVASVTLFYEGRSTASGVRSFDPDELSHRTRQDVDGRRGYFGTRGSGAVQPELLDSAPAVHLYWQYAPGAWAEAISNGRDAALELARTVRPVAKRLMVPALLAPSADQYLNSIDTETPSSLGGTFEISAKNTRHSVATVRWGTDHGIEIGDLVDVRGMKVGGRTWLFGHVDGEPKAQLKDSTTLISVRGAGGTSLATLRDYLKRVRFAHDFADRGTWFAASKLRPPG